MPYSGPDDPNLPSNVKAKPANKRRRWVAIFNSVMSRGGNESSAFRRANGATKGADDDDDQDEIEEKSHGDIIAVEPYRPWGGATSFEEIDQNKLASSLRMEADELGFQLQSIFSNIMSDPMMSAGEKATAIRLAADNFAERAGLLGDTLEEKDAHADLDEDNDDFMLPDDMDVDDWGEEEHKAFFELAGVKEFSWKYRKYINDPSLAPAGVTPTKGPRGGWYYEATPGQRAAASNATSRRAPGRAPNQSGRMGELIRLVRLLITRLMATRKEASGPPSPGDAGDPLVSLLASYGPSFTVTKDADGSYRWLAVYSNKYRDRDKEYLPESEHRRFIEWAEKNKKYPELWLWHTPGSRWGQADWLDYADGFALASGTVDKGFEDVAEQLAGDPHVAVSHGFNYQSLKNGVYQGVRTFEISPLPRAKAANEGTAFIAGKEEPMLSEDKRRWLKEKLGDSRVNQIEAALGVMKKDMDEKGLSFKEVLDDFLENSGQAAPGGDEVRSPEQASSPEGAATGLTLEAIKAAMTETVAPIVQRVEAIEQRQQGDWTPKATPAAAQHSATKAGDDALAEVIKRAEKELAESEDDDDDAGPGGINQYLRLFTVASVASANGSQAGEE